MKVKITVQSDAGSITSYDNLNKSKQAINENNNSNTKYKKSLDRQNPIQADTKNLNEINSNNKDLRKSKESSNSSNNSHQMASASKPGTEVLTLIATWIKNAPNDFMDTRVIDEIKHFFNQLDSLKSSFKPWTSKLKHALNLVVNYLN